mgnify:CR=1 FL=1
MSKFWNRSVKLLNVGAIAAGLAVTSSAASHATPSANPITLFSTADISAQMSAQVSVTAAGAIATIDSPQSKQRPLATDHFTTPSGKIQCDATGRALRCELTTGQTITPLPPRPSRCNLDWGAGLSLGSSAAVRVLCAGDTIQRPISNSVTLPYGHQWSWRGFNCNVQRTGLVCRNRGDRGFFLSTQRWQALTPRSR